MESDDFSQFRFTVNDHRNGSTQGTFGERKDCPFFLYAEDGCAFRDTHCRSLYDHELKKEISTKPISPCPYFYSKTFFGPRSMKTCKFGARCWLSHNCVWKRKDESDIEGKNLEDENTSLKEENSKLTKQVNELKVENTHQLKSENEKLKADLVQRLCLKILILPAPPQSSPYKTKKLTPFKTLNWMQRLLMR
mmetsp:Transcript_12440/g.16071  ORF Transcript_12440/g.16071 Transcript_12440/m.16071 type:complete len:193 (-) Transcript_12440:709-1287(-)